MGCRVIDSDELIRQAYERQDVRRTLRQWWGDDVFLPDGQINRPAIARRIFSDPAEKQRLERLLHPLASSQRDELMRQAADNSQVVAFIWDTPLLIETDMHRQCDAIVFVDAPFEQRLARVARGRKWDRSELERREKLQHPLDKKRKIADYVVGNTADDAEVIRGQVREVLSRILAGSSSRLR